MSVGVSVTPSDVFKVREHNLSHSQILFASNSKQTIDRHWNSHTKFSPLVYIPSFGDFTLEIEKSQIPALRAKFWTLSIFSHTHLHRFKERRKNCAPLRSEWNHLVQRSVFAQHIYIRREHSSAKIEVRRAREEVVAATKKKSQARTTMRAARIGVFDYPQMRENEYNDGMVATNKKHLALPLLLPRGYSHQNIHEWSGHWYQRSHGRKPPFLDITCTRAHTHADLCVGLFLTLAFT